MKIDYKKLLFSILVPVFLGSVVGFLTAPFNHYYELELPSFAPPGIIFPIVWTILYTLMGVSSYFVLESNSTEKKKGFTWYVFQLGVNLLWTVWFFVFRFYFFSFIWLIGLILLVGIMLYYFYKIDKKAFYLQIPYFIWLLFAAVLNFSVFLLN